MSTSTIHPGDRADLARVVEGDRQAFAALYDRHAGRCYGVILRILKSPGDAEDCLQDVWIEAWNRAGSYDSSRGPVVAWLLVLARSRALDRYRSRRSRQEARDRLEETPPAIPVEDPSRRPEERQLHEVLAACLAELAEHQRSALELAYWGGLTQSEIAERLASPLGTIKSWVRQGLTRMQRCLPEGEWL